MDFVGELGESGNESIIINTWMGCGGRGRGRTLDHPCPTRDDQTRSALGAIHKIFYHPVGDEPVLCQAVTHGGHDDPVFDLHIPNLDGCKKLHSCLLSVLLSPETSLPLFQEGGNSLLTIFRTEEDRNRP